MRILILGGTTQASALARALATRNDIRPILSLAGRTANPIAPPIPFRVGGFGGVDGLRAYLRANEIDALVDATHPFAVQMSRHAEEACRAEHIPSIAFTRPAWERRAGDDWISVADAHAAVAALGSAPLRVFLTQGRLELAAFAAAPQHAYLIRTIDPPEGVDILPRHRVILARGPFEFEDELTLMRSERVDMLVTKNSGGAATYPKIEAARQLGVRVIMIERPKSPDVEELHDLNKVLIWIDAHRCSP